MAVVYEKKGKIAYLTINRPQAMNAMDPETYQEIADAWRDIDSDENVWVGIVTGAGDKAFTAGADLKKMEGRNQERGEFWRPWQNTVPQEGLETMKPMIAAINGYCLAGGMELAMACDIRIASETASFGSPEVRWNVLHGYGALRLVNAIPLANAMDMLLTGERIDAHEAHRIGLVSRVVPQKELMPTVNNIAHQICENGPIAVRITKELAMRGQNMSLSDGLRYHAALNRILLTSDDTREGPRSFTEKRKPEYKGR